MLNVEGVAILSDLQVNSQNAEIATYTAQFTGQGELEFEEIEERPVDPEGF